MLVMPANCTGALVSRLQATYGGLGNLVSPGGWRGTALPDYALDNGRYPCWQAGKPWDEAAFWQLVYRAATRAVPPRWILVPDVVADRDGTLREWAAWAPRLAPYGWPLAVAVQDGMVPADVPAEASLVFVGGSTAWKRATMRDWCAAFPRVHIGRVNSLRWLTICHDCGAESVDGTGWLRGDASQRRGLERFLAWQASGATQPALLELP